MIGFADHCSGLCHVFGPAGAADSRGTRKACCMRCVPSRSSGWSLVGVVPVRRSAPADARKSAGSA